MQGLKHPMKKKQHLDLQQLKPQTCLPKIRLHVVLCNSMSWSCHIGKQQRQEKIKDKECLNTFLTITTTVSY
jgi:hypothetical protein